MIYLVATVERQIIVDRVYLDLRAACDYCDRRQLSDSTEWAVYEAEPGAEWHSWNLVHGRSVRAFV